MIGLIPLFVLAIALAVFGPIALVKKRKSRTLATPALTSTPAPATPSPTPKASKGQFLDVLGTIFWGLIILGVVVVIVGGVDSCMKEYRLSQRDSILREAHREAEREAALTKVPVVQRINENHWRVRVDSKKVLTKTGIEAGKGDIFRYHTEGQVAGGINLTEKAFVEAKGLGRPANNPEHRDFPLGLGSSFMQLIGRVGGGSRWQGFQTSGTLVAEEYGELQFSFNFPRTDVFGNFAEESWARHSGFIDVFVTKVKRGER